MFFNNYHLIFSVFNPFSYSIGPSSVDHKTNPPKTIQVKTNRPIEYFTTEGDFEIPQIIVQKLANLSGEILNKENDPEIEWKNSNSRVFKLKSEPRYVFKNLLNPDATLQRYHLNRKAKKICEEDELNLLVVPKAARINLNGHLFMAEECLDFIDDEYSQKHLYFLAGNALNDTIGQLALFILKMGCNDVNVRNNPLLKRKEGDPPKIALIDIDIHGDGATWFGGFLGLINCTVSEGQIDKVISVLRSDATHEGATLNEEILQETKQERLQQLKFYEGFADYYQRKQFVSGKEPLEIDLSTLGLDLHAEEDLWDPNLNQYFKISLGKVAQDLIDAINQEMAKKSDEHSIPGKRSIWFYRGMGNYNPIAYKYQSLGARSSIYLKEIIENQWLCQVLRALVAKDHLFNFSYDGHLYLIQA